MQGEPSSPSHKYYITTLLPRQYVRYNFAYSVKHSYDHIGDQFDKLSQKEMIFMSEPDNRIKAARKAAGLTQRSMSEKLGIPRRTIEDWDSGKSYPPLWVEALLLEKLGSMKDSGGN